MDWIKKNLLLVISGLGTLIAVGASGYYFYSRIAAEKEVEGQMAALQDTLTQLQTKNPYPSEENVVAAKEQEKELLQFKNQAERFFKSPLPPKFKRDADFGYFVVSTLTRLQKMAQSNSVALPTNFCFGFSVQKELMQFDTNCLDMLGSQLMDIDALSQILFQSRVYELAAIKRAAVSTNDVAGMELAPQDYLLTRKITTNDNVKAVISPYELTFKSTTTELASVLDALVQAPCGYLVKYIKAESADAEADTAASAEGASASGYVSRYGNVNAADVRRYGMNRRHSNRGAPPPPTLAPAVESQTPKKAGTVLKEKPLRISMYVESVKFLTPPTK